MGDLDFSNLRKLRKERNLLQKDLAKYLGITIASYSLYENNKRTPPYGILKKLCKFYNIDMDLLIGLREPDQYHIVYGNPFEDKEQSPTQDEYEQLSLEDAAKNAPRFTAYDEKGNTIETKDRKPPKFTDSSMSKEEAIAEAEAAELERIQAAYKRLNRKGKAKAVERVEELTEIPKYTTPDDPPQS